MKHLEVRQKYSTVYRIFNSLLSVAHGEETLRLMLDILHLKSHLQLWLQIEPSLKPSSEIMWVQNTLNYKAVTNI